MKASGNPVRDEVLRALMQSVEGDRNIRIVTDNLASSEINGIIRDSNVYLSLHRSEGFGLTVAEAIMHRTPVISTGWSGTADFCDPDNIWLVEPSLIPVVDSHPEFADLTNAVWADPSPATAAAHLKSIYSNPEAAQQKAEAARTYLVRHLAEHSYDKALSRLSAMQAS